MSQTLVSQIKQDLVTAGVNLEGPCGAFEITKRVAWTLRDTGAGLVHKRRPQNGCYRAGSDDGYGADVIMWRNGTCRDILIDSGGRNGPIWPEPEPIDATLWRPSFDPEDGSVPAPLPPSPVPLDLAFILARLDVLERRAVVVDQLVDEQQRQLAYLGERSIQLQERLLPEYEGTGRVGWLGGSFTVISHPRR